MLSTKKGQHCPGKLRQNADPNGLWEEHDFEPHLVKAVGP